MSVQIWFGCPEFFRCCVLENDNFKKNFLVNLQNWAFLSKNKQINKQANKTKYKSKQTYNNKRKNKKHKPCKNQVVLNVYVNNHNTSDCIVWNRHSGYNCCWYINKLSLKEIALQGYFVYISFFLFVLIPRYIINK